MQCFSTLSEDDCRHQILSFITTWASKPWLVLHDVCIIFNTKVKGFHIYDSNLFVYHLYNLVSQLRSVKHADIQFCSSRQSRNQNFGLQYVLLSLSKNFFFFFFLKPQPSFFSSLPGKVQKIMGFLVFQSRLFLKGPMF